MANEFNDEAEEEEEEQAVDDTAEGKTVEDIPDMPPPPPDPWPDPADIDPDIVVANEDFLPPDPRAETDPDPPTLIDELLTAAAAAAAAAACIAINSLCRTTGS